MSARSNQITRLLICSDIHYASDAEKARARYEINAISNPLQRLAVSFYRHWLWLRDPFAHNELMRHVLEPPFEPDWVVANGDYSCDSAFIGVADAAALQSARECLGRLRGRFGERFLPVFGDHELGKISMCSGKGGLRYESLRAARDDLTLKTTWTQRIGNYVLVAVTSTLAALPVYGVEALPEEREAWEETAREHLKEVAAAFESLQPSDRVLLFCHDPTALPFLWEIKAVRDRIEQIERTIIGHLHSELILAQSRLLSGLPKISFCGPTVHRISSALRRARDWTPFNVLLCPSLSGLELTKRGGFYTVEIDQTARQPAAFRLHEIRR
jgi:hypothetical protein